MEQRISLITLAVNDVNKARAFYDALGWKAASEDYAEHLIPYNLQQCAIALYNRAKFAEDTGLTLAPAGSYSPVSFSYNVRVKEEAGAVLAAAEEAGGTIVKPAHDMFWGGYGGYFADPDNHLWEVTFNPFAPLDEAGGFQWV